MNEARPPNSVTGYLLVALTFLAAGAVTYFILNNMAAPETSEDVLMEIMVVFIGWFLFFSVGCGIVGLAGVVIEGIKLDRREEAERKASGS